MILAIETATNVCSVALKTDEGEPGEKRIVGGGVHSEKLFQFIESFKEEGVLDFDRLEVVLISAGPGSYTGLRIGASAVKGLLFQSDIPLYAIDTLAGFARSALEQKADLTTIHTIIDARRVHLYHQKYSLTSGKLVAEKPVQIDPIEEVEESIQNGDAIIGTGYERLSDSVTDQAVLFKEASITAKSLIQLFDEEQEQFYRIVDVEEYDPKYYTSNQVEE